MAKMIVGVYSKNISFTENKSIDLYITIDNKNLFFSVKSIKNGQFLAFEHYKSAVDEIGWDEKILSAQNNSKLIKLNFNNVFFVWNNKRFTLSKKISKQDVLYYQQELNLVHGVNNHDEIFVNSINDDLVLAFSVPGQIISLTAKLFPNGVWHHYTEYMNNSDSENNALICLFENEFCLKITNNRKIQLVNYFPIEGNDQNIYQIINACNHSSLETNYASLKIWGYEDKQHEFINTLSNYFNAGQVAEPQEYWDNEDKENCPNNIYSTYFIY